MIHSIPSPAIRQLLPASLFALAIFSAPADPIAAPDGYESPEDELLTVSAADGVLMNDTPDAGTLSARLDTDVSDGTLALAADGSFTYLPDPDFNGSDTFTYVAQETPSTLTFTVDQGQSNVDFSARIVAGILDQTRSDNSSLTGTLTIQLNPPSSPFSGVHIQDLDVVLADNISLSYGIPPFVSVNVSANGGDISLNMAQAGPPTTADAGGAFTQVMNDFALSGTANVTSSGIDIGVPNGPQALDTTLENIDLSGTFTEAGGIITLNLPVTFQGTFDLSGNTVELDINGTLVATAPVPAVVESAPALVTIDVEPVNDAPSVVADNYYAFDGAQLAVPAAQGADEVLVAAGSTWSFLDDGSDQGTAWKEPGFDDAAWASGPAKLGYDSAEATTVSFGPDPNNKFVTTYFRHRFNLADPEQTASLLLRLNRDDAAAVYLNGTEVARDEGLPASAAFDTMATITAAGGDETTFFEFPIDPAALVGGENVIAVEVHQATADTSDCTFDLELLRTPAAGVLANDADVDGNALTATLAMPPSNGVANVAADGSFDYTPAGGFVGVDQFTYSVVNVGDKIPFLVLPANAPWSFLDDGSDQGTAWRAPGFDDSAWASGRAQLGYGEGDEATAVGFGPDENNKFVTTYFRSRFIIGDPSEVSNVLFRLLRDDAAAVYLNGTEVYRDPNLDPEAAFDTLATSGVDEANAEITISVAPGNLVAGENVIAVEVHQNAVTSSDLSFAMSVSVSIPPPLSVSPLGAGWSFLDDGSDQGTAWRAPAFDDSAWGTGPAPLGYNADEATTVSFGPDANAKFTTTYFRREFDVYGTANAVAALLRLRRDDGAAVYLNGVEIARDNLAPAATSADLATATVGGDDETALLEFSFDPALLIDGTNVLAAEVHQAAPTSSDIGFDAEIVLSQTAIEQKVTVNVVSAAAPGADTDNDGMLDSYETANGLTVGIDDSAEDLDGDGRTNLEESIAGTAANDPNSYLEITDVQPAPADQLALTIATEVGKIYKVQTSIDGAVWTDVDGSQFTAAGATEVVNVDRTGGVRLWRAVVVVP